MSESYVNIAGFVGSDLESRDVGDGVAVTTFRVASTPRRWNNKDRSWVDAPTNWYTVNAWRTLGRNCLTSLHKGDPVTVYGKLSSQVWTDANGVERQTMVVEAASAGPDLNLGRSTFERVRAEGIDRDELARTNVEMGLGGPQVSSDGETVDEMVVDTDTGELLDEAV